MNTSPASNPFTGLKGALAGLMSGGWVGLLLGLLFQRRIATMLAALEGLFAQWKAGTLAPLAVAQPVPAPVRHRAASPAVARTGRRSPCGRLRATRCRADAAPVAAPRTAVLRPQLDPAPVLPWAAVTAVLAPHRPARCRRKTRRDGATLHVRIVTISK
jgi:predicted lipid-binding transport protein (Tim44 family)